MSDDWAGDEPDYADDAEAAEEHGHAQGEYMLRFEGDHHELHPDRDENGRFRSR